MIKMCSALSSVFYFIWSCCASCSWSRAGSRAPRSVN